MLIGCEVPCISPTTAPNFRDPSLFDGNLKIELLENPVSVLGRDRDGRHPGCCRNELPNREALAVGYN